MKKRFVLGLIMGLSMLSAKAQKKSEQLKINWPGEYDWKVIKQQRDGTTKTVIILGKKVGSSDPIIGSMTAYQGAISGNNLEIINHYKGEIDAGSVFSLLENDSTTKYHWVIFKIETPITNKYPEPESDLYYIVQGEYALYENHVAIKKPNLDPDFIAKWTAIFKESEVEIK